MQAGHRKAKKNKLFSLEKRSEQLSNFCDRTNLSVECLRLFLLPLFFSYPFLSVVEGEPQLYIMSRHANPSCLQHHINSVSWLWMFITIKGLDTVKHNFFPNTAQPRLGPAGGSHEHFFFFLNSKHVDSPPPPPHPNLPTVCLAPLLCPAGHL